MTKAKLDEARRGTVHFADSLSVDEQDAFRSAILLNKGAIKVEVEEFRLMVEYTQSI